MPMARALRRTLSPQIQERHKCASSSSSGGKISGGVNMLQNGRGGGGGGSLVFAVEKAHEHNSNHSQHNYVSSLTSLPGGGMGGATGFSSAPLPRSASHSDNLLSLANLSFIFPLPCLRFMGRTGGAMERQPKSSRGMFWKRPLLHLLLSLVLGIVIGFSSISWSDLPSPPRNETPHELALVNGFVTNLRREGSQTVNRGEKLITYDSWRVSTGVGRIGDVTSGADNSRALQIEQLGSGLSELAPGLNYTLDPERKLLIIVTPTYNRAFQAHYLTRLAHALRLVPPPLLWLVVEMPFQTLETASFLRQTGIMYRHLVCRTNLTNIKTRVTHQRNFALEHIEMHQLNGIVYFADDDNVYSQDLFEQMRKIRRFGTWPVAMLAESKAKAILEGPVCDGEKVIGWHTNEKSKSMYRFHVDMSGFAFNSTFLWDTLNWRHRSAEPIRQLDTVKEGLQETNFIEQLVEDEDQMQGLPSGCSKIMVWHLHMEAPELTYPYGWSLGKPLFPNIPLQIRT